MGPSMSEAKMKPRRGNGTPHPKGRRSVVHTPHVEHSQCRQLQHDGPDEANQNETRSSLQDLLQVHTQVTQTLHQIDTMVLNMHKLALSNHVADGEVGSFADALANINADLQVQIFTQITKDWNNFLRAAAERSSLSHSNLDRELPTAGSRESTPPSVDKCTSLSPLITDLECCAISYSPLVPHNLLDCESLCDTESLCDSDSLVRTPPDRTLGSTHRSTSLSPLPQTPYMLSPPRSIRVLSTISESPSLSTPSHPISLYINSDYHQSTPSPEDIWTPEHSTCQNQLVFETPSPQIIHREHPNDEIAFLQTPGFGVSPPRTCDPLRHGEPVATESVNVPPTPVMPSPFRTPGILFECSSVASESSSPDSPAIVDDLTTSTVKRLGPRGLEERLWQELAIRKADVLQSVQFR
ncbi:hypothetical protein KC19_10G144000 [Ceratodon purpureus]|uniref:DASH complex subunit ASK1 n=1 Tax=Ceratodon purpureus TaxID=3225 RepID=A0A8T0GN13_CERPU|nr:hypothetical protein KC19_10G144000 [Ceratodon purpureus]